MTPLPFVPQVLRINLSYQVGSNRTCASRFYWKIGASPRPTVSDLNLLATAIEAQWQLALEPMHTTQVNLQGVTVQDLTDALGAFGSSATVIPGTRAGQLITQDVCAVVAFTIGRHYRGGKPRLYLPAGSEADAQDERTWSNTFRDELNAAWTTFKTGINNQTQFPFPIVDHCNVGYYSGVEPPTTLPSGRVKQANKKLATPFVDLVTGHNVNAVFGSQRRRLAH